MMSFHVHGLLGLMTSRAHIHGPIHGLLGLMSSHANMD
jgi:hypothetical protein